MLKQDKHKINKHLEVLMPASFSQLNDIDIPSQCTITVMSYIYQ